MKPRILIVEDRPYLAEDLVDRLTQFGYEQLVGPFDTAESALVACKNNMPHIAILDIRLNGKMTGVELANILNQEQQKVSIIFLTNLEDDETINMLSTTEHIAYINKPFTNAELRVNITRALQKLALVDEKNVETNSVSGADKFGKIETIDDRIFIRSGRKRERVMLDDIAWLQSTKGKGEGTLIVLVGDNDKPKKYQVSQGLKEVLKRLKFYDSLMRVSKSHIVNIKQVSTIDDQDRTEGKNPSKILIVDGKKIEIGRTYLPDVMKRFHSF